MARERSSGGVTADPDTVKCASPAARQSQAQAARLLTGQPTASIQDGLAWIRQTPHAARRTRLATSGVRPQHAKVLGGLIHEYERAA